MRAVSCLTRFLYRSDLCYLFKFISISEIGLILVGALLAICSGAGLPHLVEIVGWMLNQYIFLETGEFRAKYIPLLTYFCTMAVLLAIIAFFQHVCFRMSAIKIGRRLRRRYFRNVLYQELCFFDDENFDSKEFDSAVRSLQTVIGDSLPNIILTIAQVAVAMIVSFTLAWRLAGVVAIIAFGCCIWTMILNKLIALATASLNGQNARLAKCIDDEINFVRVLNSQRWRGTLKGFLEGLLVGSTQFFPYIAWAVGAFYGNWLLDNNLMNKPTYIFVCASSLMPAWIRFAALPGHLTTLFGIAKVSRLLKKAQANPHKRESFSLNDETQAELEKRQKDVLIKLIKSEIGELPEPHYHHKSAAFSQVRRKALSHWILFPIAFLCCAMVGASAAVISVLNGRMFSMYKYKNTYPYYERGIQWGIKYFILGGTVFITGIISGTLYGWISENAIRKIRYSAMQCCHSKLLEKQALVDILTKYTTPIKAAFDNRQSAFLIGIMSIICAVLSNIPKNIIICALCAVTFGVQTISQFFVFRFADICTKHAQRASIKKGLELIDQLEEIPTETIGDSIREISKAHSRYLSFVLNKEGPAMLAQSLRFSFTLAVPQITQAFSYAIGGYFIADDYIAPFDVYRIIQAAYASVATVSTLAQFPHNFYLARLAAQHVDDLVDLGSTTISRLTSTCSTDSDDF
uniref:ABC transmembrane type-1 domain-containing protein n=1 Tax=Panagrellus redivivus TaxID=6233 RepID=A0A7E4W7Y9_PANRE